MGNEHSNETTPRNDSYTPTSYASGASNLGGHGYSSSNFTAYGRSAARPQSSAPERAKTEKSVYIQADNGQRVKVSFQVSEEDSLTCGWLVSQTIREFTDQNIQEFSSERPIIALQTLENIITLDYWLADVNRSVSVLKDGMVLKPFYGNVQYTVKDEKIGLEYFHLLKVIGSGGFSKVYLARRKDNGQFYAIKVITKKDMIKKDKEENVFNERNIMARLHHPFLVKLSYAFQNPEKLFLVMDFCPGGELFYHLNQRQRLREHEAKIYMGEIILALNYLHKNKIIYRDLKPENILLDIDGHLHLTDFGLCKITQNKIDLNYTFCGSPEYMSPEIIKRSGYNFSADFYTLGALIYEMVVGRPPFNADNNKELFQKILHQDVYYPSFISPNLKMFLSQLLEKNPKERLGAKYGLPEIVNHPWCRDLDFVKIASKDVKAPIIPDMYRTNFAREFIDAKITVIETSPSHVQNSGSVNYIAPTIKFDCEIPSGVDNPTLYRKFANFSFYSNIDDPYEKFQDSIFESNESTPVGSPREAPKDKFPDLILTEDITNIDIKKIQMPITNITTNIQSKTVANKNENIVKEDYSDEINERSPNIKGISEYGKLKTKFLSQTLKYNDTTPKKGALGMIDLMKNDKNRMTSLSFDFQKTESPPTQSQRISYSSRQKDLKTTARQVPAKIVASPDITPNRMRNTNWETSSRLLDEVSDEITTRDDKPFTHIANNRTLYHQSNMSSMERIKTPLSNENKFTIEKGQSFPFAVYEDRNHQQPNFKNMTADFSKLGSYSQSINKKPL